MWNFIRVEARWVGAGMLLTGFSGFGQTFFVALSNPALRGAFDLSHGEIGLIYAAATLTSAVILLEFGKIVDGRPTRGPALLVTLGLAAACLLLALSPVWWMLFPAFLGLRLFGQGMMSHVAMTATGRWFSRQRGRAVSLASLGYPIGEMILPPVAVFAIAAIGWRQTWAICAAALVLVAAPLLMMLLRSERAPSQEEADHLAAEAAAGAPQWRRRDVMREWSFWVMLTGVLSPAFMVTGLFFHQLHLVDLKGWSAPVFAGGFTVFAIVGIVSALIAGAAIDKMSSRALLPTYLLPMAIALILLFLVDDSWVIFAKFALLGVTAGGAQTVMGAIWPELFGVKWLGEIRALTFTGMVAASAASPFLVGVLIDAGIGFPLQLLVMGGYALLASAVMGLIQPRLAAIASGAVKPRLEE